MWYVELALKDKDHCERFDDEPWDMIFHRQYRELKLEYELEQLEKEEQKEEQKEQPKE